MKKIERNGKKLFVMSKMTMILLLLGIVLNACEKDNMQNDVHSGELKSGLSDTLVLAINDTLHQGNKWLTMTDVAEDSRCPEDVICFWAGDAVVQLLYFDGENSHQFDLHTNPDFQTDTVIQILHIKLLDLVPAPVLEQEIDKSDYKASLYITDDSSTFDGNKGTVVDYTGLDGCGFIIELDNGTKLEPMNIPAGFQLYDGQRVELTYTKADGMAGICMVGDMVNITEIRNVGCPAYHTRYIDTRVDDLPSDDIVVEEVIIEDGCLRIAVGYSGGCKEHEIKLVQLPLMCATPPLPKPIFYLTHNNNGDECEAFIHADLSYDLKPLKQHYPNGTDFILMTPDQKYSKEFHVDF